MGETVTILGIDPGSQVLGWGAITWHGRSAVSLVDFGAIRVTRKEEVGGRLVEINGRLTEVLDRVRPQAVALLTRRLTWGHPSRLCALLLKSKSENPEPCFCCHTNHTIWSLWDAFLGNS